MVNGGPPIRSMRKSGQKGSRGEGKRRAVSESIAHDDEAPAKASSGKGLGALVVAKRAVHSRNAALENPDTKAEIWMHEDPHGAERAGVVRGMIEQGKHIPCGDTVEPVSEGEPIFPHTRKPSRIGFRKANSVSPVCHVCIHTDRDEADTGKVYAFLKQKAQAHGRGSIIVAERTTPNINGSMQQSTKVIGISIPLNNMDVAHLSALGADVLNAYGQPYDVKVKGPSGKRNLDAVAPTPTLESY